MKEKWKPVVGHEGLYEVSDQGSVRSVDRTIRAAASWRRPAHNRRYAGQPLRPGRYTKQGHLSVVLRSGNGAPVHALVLAAFVGPRPEGAECLHANGDATDNRLANLRYGTRSENNRDTTRHGSRRLTVVQVKAFRAARAGGATLQSLADKYSICRSQAHNIATRKQYAHI